MIYCVRINPPIVSIFNFKLYVPSVSFMGNGQAVQSQIKRPNDNHGRADSTSVFNLSDYMI